MNRPATLLGTVMSLPLAVTLMLSAAAPSQADEGECDSVLFGLVMDCSDKDKDKGKDRQKPTDQPTSTATPTRSPNAPVAPSPTSAPSTTSATVKTPDRTVAPTPQATVTLIEKTKEVIVTKEVTVPQSNLPPLGPTQKKPTTPTVTSSAAVAPTTSASPTEEIPLDSQQAAAGSFIPRNVLDAGPILFFIGLAGITTMLVIARTKRYFPFEKGSHSS